MNGTEHERSDVTVLSDGGSEATAVAVSDTYDDATTRDRVWSAAVRLLVRRQPLGFRLCQVREEAGMAKSKDRTIRRTLNAMEELGWLEREEDEKYWHPGERVEEIVEVDIPEQEPLEVLDDRIDYLENYTPRDASHKQRLEERKADLELVRRRITGDSPAAVTNGDNSYE